MKTYQKIITVFFLISITACGLNSNPGNGEKIGQIVKLSKVGMINDTWEGEIIRGGFQGGAGVNGMAFDFTVESDSLATIVKGYMESQREVRISYRSEGIYYAIRSSSGGDFLTSIIPLKSDSTK